jgi:hypothetical protein
MEVGGNARINSIFEATMVFDSCKPDGRSDNATRAAFIREKYANRNFYDGSFYKQTQQQQQQQQQAPGLPPSTPKLRSKDTLKPASFSSLANHRTSDPFFSSSFQNSTNSFQESIGLDRPQSKRRSSLDYGDLFEPSEHQDEEDDEEEVDDFLATRSHSHSGLSEDEEINDSMDDDDLFADSETTATDLFGSSTNYPKSKKATKKATTTKSIPLPPIGISEEDSERSAEDWEAFSQTGNAMSPSAMSRKSVESARSVKTAPASFRPNYGGQNALLWRDANLLSPTKSPSNSVGRIMTKQTLAVKTNRRNSVLSSLDTWLDPVGGEPMSLTLSSNTPTTGTTQPHRRSHSSSSGHRRSLPPSSSSAHRRGVRSERLNRTSAPAVLVDAFGFSSASSQEQDDDNDDDVEGELDLNATHGSDGFEAHFGDGGFGVATPLSPGSLSIQSMPICAKSALDSFLKTDLEQSGGSGSVPSSSPRRSSGRRLSSRRGSLGSTKSAPTSDNERKHRLRDTTKPPLTRGGGEKSKSSSSRPPRRLSGSGGECANQASSSTQFTTTSTSSTGSASSSSSPSGVMDFDPFKTTDMASPASPEKVSRSERRSSRTGTRTSVSGSASPSMSTRKSRTITSSPGQRSSSPSAAAVATPAPQTPSGRRERRLSARGMASPMSATQVSGRSKLPPSSPAKKSHVKTMAIKSTPAPTTSSSSNNDDGWATTFVTA